MLSYVCLAIYVWVSNINCISVGGGAKYIIQCVLFYWYSSGIICFASHKEGGGIWRRGGGGTWFLRGNGGALLGKGKLCLGSK